MVDTEVKPTDIDVTQLTPLSPEVISKQATINIGNSTQRKRHSIRNWRLGWRFRYDWSCRSREINGGESHLGCPGMYVCLLFDETEQRTLGLPFCCCRLSDLRTKWNETLPSSWVMRTLKFTSAAMMLVLAPAATDLMGPPKKIILLVNDQAVVENTNLCAMYHLWIVLGTIF